MSDIEERIEEHCNGGLYNPEPMQHEKVRALLIDCLEEIKLLRGYRDEAEADAAVARLLLDKSRLTETEMDAMQTAIDTLHAVQDQTKDPCAKTAIAAARIMRLRDRLKPIGNVDSDRPQPIDPTPEKVRLFTERLLDKGGVPGRFCP